jgi:AcrR family transcriptional regulator
VGENRATGQPGAKGDVLSTVVPVDPDKPVVPRSRKGAASRARLLDAAKQIFEENGFPATRVSDITRRGGFSHGSFYHYFESKEQIFREVAMRVTDTLYFPLSAIIFDATSAAQPRERIRNGTRLYLESYRNEARIIGVIEQVTRHDEQLSAALFEYQERDRERVADSIRELRRRGLVDADVNPEIAARALGAMMSRFAEMWFVQEFVDCDFDEGVEQLASMFVKALGLRSSAERHTAGLRQTVTPRGGVTRE